MSFYAHFRCSTSLNRKTKTELPSCREKDGAAVVWSARFWLDPAGTLPRPQIADGPKRALTHWRTKRSRRTPRVDSQSDTQTVVMRSRRSDCASAHDIWRRAPGNADAGITRAETSNYINVLRDIVVHANFTITGRANGDTRWLTLIPSRRETNSAKAKKINKPDDRVQPDRPTDRRTRTRSALYGATADSNRFSMWSRGRS
ncbi:hypothetical protein EVAR_86880_1 [Eumeta japonica]|uniref:Uncharacterized protein n=1 Tax=Eumeta variegata TaxID=151549 RepID=A0A4C1ZL12_EUMVA|nr:hypothetical protein EVAR_86880_1 [Eumeta japonica]